MTDMSVGLAIGLPVGFAGEYAVRAAISLKHRQAAIRRPLPSIAVGTELASWPHLYERESRPSLRGGTERRSGGGDLPSRSGALASDAHHSAAGHPGVVL